MTIGIRGRHETGVVQKDQLTYSPMVVNHRLTRYLQKATYPVSVALYVPEIGDPAMANGNRLDMLLHLLLLFSYSVGLKDAATLDMVD